MKIAVLGASGKGGSLIAKELAARGHSVVGIARKPEAVPQIDGVTAIAGDATDPATLAGLIKGVDAVISAIHFDVSCATLLSAVKQAGVGRLLVMGGAASLNNAEGVMLYDAEGFPEFLKPLVKPAITFLDDLRGETDVDWTFYSPAMNIFEGECKGPGSVRLGGEELVVDEKGESNISYADFAIVMVDELENHKYSRARFTGAY